MTEYDPEIPRQEKHQESGGNTETAFETSKKSRDIKC